MTFAMMPKFPGSGWKEKNSSDPPRPALVGEKRDAIVFSLLFRAGPTLCSYTQRRLKWPRGRNKSLMNICTAGFLMTLV